MKKVSAIFVIIIALAVFLFVIILFNHDSSAKLAENNEIRIENIDDMGEADENFTYVPDLYESVLGTYVCKTANRLPESISLFADGVCITTFYNGAECIWDIEEDNTFRLIFDDKPEKTGMISGNIIYIQGFGEFIKMTDQ